MIWKIEHQFLRTKAKYLENPEVKLVFKKSRYHETPEIEKKNMKKDTKKILKFIKNFKTRGTWDIKKKVVIKLSISFNKLNKEPIIFASKPSSKPLSKQCRII